MTYPRVPICIILGCCFSFLGWNACFGQSRPEPIAKTRLGNQTLEVHAVVPLTASPLLGAHGTNDLLFEVMDFDIGTKINAELGITPWDKEFDMPRFQPPTLPPVGGGSNPADPSSGSPFEEMDAYVLGLLLVNDDGSLPHGMSKTCTAYRGVTESGKGFGAWPFGKRSPLEDITSHRWEFPLTPLVIQVPRGAKSVDKLEGVLVTTPGNSGVLEIPRNSLDDGYVGDKNVFVVAAGADRLDIGLRVGFGILAKRIRSKTDKNKATNSVLDKLASLNKGLQVDYVAILADNSQKPANTVQTAQFGDDKQRKMLKGIRGAAKEMIDSKQATEEDLKFIFSKDDIYFQHAYVGFLDIFDCQKIRIEYFAAEGGPRVERFIFDSFPIEPSGDLETVRRMVAELASQSGERHRGAVISEMRTWQDSTGKFKVEAKLIEATEDSVRLEKLDGKQITVPRSKLSDSDRKYLESQR